MPTLTDEVLTCKRCKSGELKELVYYSPVYSFGNPEGKKITVVAHNPSTLEFERNYLASNGTVEDRLERQFKYFDDENYYKPFFQKLESFFEGEVKSVLGWRNSCWEKVGFIDLAKCSTRTYCGQWGSLKDVHRKMIVQNCEGYLIKQLQFYRPEVILAYGKSSCEWFGNKYNVSFSNPSASIIKTDYSDSVKLIFVYQKQGRRPHSSKEVSFVRREIVNTPQSKNS